MNTSLNEQVRAVATAADGTEISYTDWGVGDPIIIVDGATSYPAINPSDEEIGRLLADSFRTFAYDRRGRGESTDTPPYCVEREIEDLAALIDIAGAPVTVFGWSSGAVLALDAASAGLPITRLALFEPPFIVDDSRAPLPSDYVERLDAALADGRPDDAVELFLTAAVGVPADWVAEMRAEPVWPVLEEVASTIAYDGRIMGSTMSGNPLPTDRWVGLDIPTLVMRGTGAEPFIEAGTTALSEMLPNATLLTVDGAEHTAPPDVVAAVLREFTSSARTAEE